VLRSAFGLASNVSAFVVLFKIDPPAAPVLPIVTNEKFGTFSFYEQLSGKLSDLPLSTTYSVQEPLASRLALRSRIRFREFATWICAVHMSQSGPLSP
jgi:hypothetical protein